MTNERERLCSGAGPRSGAAQESASASPRAQKALLVFLKAPRAGNVKTRLAAAIGDDLAVEVYRALTTALMNSTAAAHLSECARVVCFSPQDAEAEIAAWLDGEVLEPQGGVDLGARMDQAFANSFARGSTATVLIGTDSLSVDHLAVAAAFAALDTADVVLRGAEDGGYTLIGLKRRQPALFSFMEWSTDTVLAVTLARASKAGLRISVHGPDADIDTVDDLRRHFAAVRTHLDDGVARRIEALLKEHA